MKCSAAVVRHGAARATAWLALTAVLLPAQQLATAIRMADDWLANAQQPNGCVVLDVDHQSPVADLAATALAVLAWSSGGNTLRLGPRRAGVRSAVEWLKAQQREDGAFLAKNVVVDAQEAVLAHALVTMALAEAYVLSDQYRPLRSAVVQAFVAMPVRVEANGKLRGDALTLPLAILARQDVVGTSVEHNLGTQAALQELLVASVRADGTVPWYGPPPSLFGASVGLEQAALVAMLPARFNLGDKPQGDSGFARAGARLPNIASDFGPRGERLDGLLLWLGSLAVSRDRAGAEATRAWHDLVTDVLLPMQKDDGRFEFACGMSPLRGPGASTACALLAMHAQARRH